MEVCIVSNNGKFEAVKYAPTLLPLNCVLVVPDGKTWKNEYLLVNTNVKVSWQDYYPYAGYRVLKIHYKNFVLFSEEKVANPQVVIDILNKYNSISKEELETMLVETQERVKTSLEQSIEDLVKEKGILEAEIKIYKEIQTKKAEIKELLAKLDS